mmetsp:Transcript_2207/g.3640  ORF Transcript_2207/g.3640 Transcript_2207/m.3640 type:complete len:300 (+) Transcript_2207:3-902(+)
MTGRRARQPVPMRPLLASVNGVGHRALRPVMTCRSSLQPFVIVGGGRVGSALKDMGPGTDVLVGRNQPVQGLDSGPILVCTRNDALPAVVEATPPQRRKDLVFLQNGMLQPWLDSQGLGDNTQVLVFFAVAAKGDKVVDGKTDVNPEGLTAACGPYARVVADRLHAGGLSCKVLDRPAFTVAMLEKLVWICAFMLLGAVHKLTVGEVECTKQAELKQLIEELMAGGTAELGIPGEMVQSGAVTRLNAYARSVAHFPTAIKEFPWRNGWFYGISQRELAAGRPDPFPFHSSLLEQSGAIP